MAYYHKVLTADENVKAIGHLHWIIFIHAILFLIAAIVVFVLGQAFVPTRRPARRSRSSRSSSSCSPSSPGSAASCAGSAPRSW